MSSRWRGTLVYVGSLAVIGAAAFARYELSVAEEADAHHAAGHHAGHSMSPSAEGGGEGGKGSEKGSRGKASPAASPDGDGSGTTTDGGQDPAADQPAGEPAAEPEEVTITGAVIDTREGHVQVAVTFLGDEIVDINPLQAGHQDSPHGEQLNAEALPQLEEWALAAQSAQIDSVSGATYTSEGYKASLQSAIDLRG